MSRRKMKKEMQQIKRRKPNRSGPVLSARYGQMFVTRVARYISPLGCKGGFW